MSNLSAYPYLERGVYRGPYMTTAGKAVYMAVDANHRLVKDGSAEIGVEDDPQPTVSALWRLLDRADPSHARRRVQVAPKPKPPRKRGK